MDDRYHDSCESLFLVTLITPNNPNNPGTRDCLNNAPVSVWTSANGSVCGNGLWEDDEECDCGNTEDCGDYDPCCDAATCTLISGAECSSLAPCCDDTCSIVPANTVSNHLFLPESP